MTKFTIRALCPGCHQIRESAKVIESRKDKIKRYMCSSCGWQLAEITTKE